MGTFTNNMPQQLYTGYQESMDSWGYAYPSENVFSSPSPSSGAFMAPNQFSSFQDLDEFILLKHSHPKSKGYFCGYFELSFRKGAP